jgi:hypothetical protein
VFIVVEAEPMKQMSCQPSRDRFAEILRQFASGRLTNDEFEDRASEFRDDEVVNKLYWFVWMFYDDLYEHRLLGKHRLSPLQRRVFAQCVLFLRSGLPYEWDKSAKYLWCRQRDKVEPAARVPWWKPDMSVLTAPLWGKQLKEWQYRREEDAERRTKGRVIVDDRIWPFRRMSDYKTALKNPPYLCGV